MLKTIRVKAIFIVAMSLLLCGGYQTVVAETGSIQLQSAGPLAFAPDGVVLVGDTKAATLYAIETGDTKPLPANKDEVNVKQINTKIAAALGTSADNILINDLAVNPESGKAYLSVSRGKGPDAAALILTITPQGDITELSLSNVKYTKAALPNAPANDATDDRGRATRTLSITDMSYHKGKVVIAGLSNEEFASNLRLLEYPFKDVSNGSSVEIYHGNHGRWETRAPVQTFTTVAIDGVDYVIAAYTCTPLVLFPMDALTKESKINGVTVAELGARNRPLDMFVYGEGDNRSILMSNSTYGIMKIKLKDITKAAPITERVGGTAGQDFETVEELQGVVQLAQVGNSALAIIDNNGSMDLRSITLP